MKVIGITGPSGSGKSKISQSLRQNGYCVYDVDDLARNIRHKFVSRIIDLFGKEYLKEDGGLDTKKLAILVFNNRTELKKLNDLMFPGILDEIRKVIERHKAVENKMLFFDIPVLFESGAEKLFDNILLVTAPREVRLERLIHGRNISREVAEAQVDSVFITHEEISRCNLVLVNDGDEEVIDKKLQEWLNNLRTGTN